MDDRLPRSISISGKNPSYFCWLRGLRQRANVEFRLGSYCMKAVLLVLPMLLGTQVWGACIPFSEAMKHIGETRCITGKVFAVEEGSKGIRYLNFCEDYTSCPFSVVIFPRDLRHVGDVRQLQGRVVEIHGQVKMYDRRAEIILREARQLTGEAAQIPPLPKSFDVEKKGRYSAGKFSYPQSPRKPSKKRQTAGIQTEDQSDPPGSPD